MAADPRLFAEWHPDNPPAAQVARKSMKRFMWVCLEGHSDYEAACHQRCSQNTGCPACGNARKGPGKHPKLSARRPDLAEQWDPVLNDKSHEEVTLGSRHKACWRCKDNPEHLWRARVDSRALMGTGCPMCNSRFKKRIFGHA